VGTAGLSPDLLLVAGDFLTPELQVLTYTIVVFLAMLGLLWKFAWGPLMKALEEREQRIARKIADAEKANQDALARLHDYEAKIQHAKEEAAEIIAEGKRDVEKVRDDTIRHAQEESVRTLERAKREITMAKEAAVQELRDQMVVLTAELTTKVIQREVKADDHRRFISETIASLEKGNTSA
jgi:F-type H+-transporting ATPase subunit b